MSAAWASTVPGTASVPDAVRIRQENAHARSLPGLAVNLNVPARLLDEAVDHAQAEPGAGAGRLGGEERLERAPAHLFRHARSGVGDRDQDIMPGADIRIRLRIVGVEARVSDFDRQSSAAQASRPAR